MTDRQILREKLCDNPPVADAQVTHITALNRFEGIIDVYTDEITNPKVYLETLNEIVTVTDHGHPVKQQKLTASLSHVSRGTYNRDVHRYEFVKQTQP